MFISFLKPPTAFPSYLFGKKYLSERLSFMEFRLSIQNDNNLEDMPKIQHVSRVFMSNDWYRVERPFTVSISL